MNPLAVPDGHETDGAPLIQIYRTMVLIRSVDERVRAALRTGQIVAPYYSPRGQEGIAAVLGAVLRSDDYLITTYRGLHDHLAKGVPLVDLIAEYAGRVTGSCRGKGGPMHITHPAVGVMVTTGIVGSGIPIANGFGLASQVRGDDRVTVVSFGDGATNIGAFHEAMNLAALWKLPVIFLCQNNGYAEHTSFRNGTAAENVAGRASSYGMVGVTVDGNDAEEMFEALCKAVARARAAEGPTLLEAKTFRFEGHSYGDPGDYIPEEVMAAARQADPFPRMEAMLGLGKNELDSLRKEIESIIDDAFEVALAAPYPDVSELARDVYHVECEG